MQPDLPTYWYQRRLHPRLILLLPFSWLFGLITAIRRWLYRIKIFKTTHFPVPVIVVGNITVGGTGKTPLVIWLAKTLRDRGFSPGIVSRGVGGKNRRAHLVSSLDKANEVGDEALLLMRETRYPVVVAPNRVHATQYLLQKTRCNVVISDDGLQHYRLGRTLEIGVVDGVRCFGNGKLLPAGPLREPISRLNKANFIVINTPFATQNAALNVLRQPIYQMKLEPTQLVSLKDQTNKQSLEQFMPRKVHAVAAIGHPQKFFNLLQTAGFNVQAHAFPDHYLYQAEDFNFDDSAPVIMTAKDAVKCEDFCDARFWYLDTISVLNDSFKKNVLEALKAYL